MAAEARADSSAPAAAAPPPLPVPEKRSAPEEERPGTKRRRACVAALDGVPGAAAAGGHGEGDGPSFSFQHARGGFASLETTPKFGSFNPPVSALHEALDPTRSGPDSPAVKEKDEEDTAAPPGVEDGKDGNSRSAAGVDDEGRHPPERQT